MWGDMWVAPQGKGPGSSATRYQLFCLFIQVTAAAAKPLRVMIAGAPAAGKGTQCAKIVEKVSRLLGGWIRGGTGGGLWFRKKSCMG